MVDILLNHEPKLVKAQDVVKLQLTPVDSEAGDSPLELEQVHTKDVHLIIVSEDLSFFAHVHPQKAGKAYAVEFTFPFGGKFLVYNDIKPLNGSPVVIRKDIEVAGEQRPPQQYSGEVLSGRQGKVSVQLDARDPSAIQVHITQNGNPVPASSLSDYLGAKAHVVILPLESKAYLHVHPMVHQNRLVLHTAFGATGTYRAWLRCCSMSSCTPLILYYW
ncbi:hypothetical protein GCM10028895_52420 [Pontibacter rugosus]